MKSRLARPVDEGGYSIVELLLASAIVSSLMAGVLALAISLHVGLRAEGERADLQQRLRVAVDALSRDLALAGAGTNQGARAGPLGFSIASVVPFRQGAAGADPAGAFRTDAITVLSVAAQTAAQTTIGLPLPAWSGTASINLDPGCPPDDSACGFAAGTDVLVFDDTGSYDTFRVTAVQAGALQLQHDMADTPQVYAAGARIAAASSHTYLLKTDAATDTFQLVHYDGVASEAAVVDHLVGLAFEYFGDPAPPLLVKPITDPSGPWTTYGPKPPPPNAAPTAYPAGENCVFQLDPDKQPVPRLPMLGDGSPALVKLTAAELTDGPWCPDAANPHRYDADLLRVRKIGVTIRLETALSALRGPAGVLFARGGTSRFAGRWVADLETRFDISPRNLTMGR